MSSFLVAATATSVACVLIIAGIAHALRWGGLARALRAQRIWPEWSIPTIASLVVATELGTGGALLASIWTTGNRASSARGASAAAGCLLLGYALYLTFLLVRRPGAPCGCASGDEPASVAALIRTTFVAAGTLPALLVGTGSVAQLSGVEIAIVVETALVFALAALTVPSALAPPQLSWSPA